MLDLPTLIAKLRTADAGSRDLDCEIALHTGWTIYDHVPQTNYDMEWSEWIPPGQKPGDKHIQVPRYTESIDAAITLIPVGYIWCCGFSRYVPHHATVSSSKLAHGGWSAEVDSNRAIAICIAALKARADQC